MQHGLAAEWQRFRADPPGERFCNHYQRARDSSKAARVAQAVGGVVLLAAGIVLCFVPGPGLLVMLFGFALLSTLSRRIARVLDRVELAARRLGGRLKQRWRRWRHA